MNKINILMYHNIADDDLDPYAVSLKLFTDQMEWLKKEKYKVITLAQAFKETSAGKPNKKTVVLTFDDGTRDFIENAVPILSKFQYPVTLFLVAGEVGGCSVWREPKSQNTLLNWNEACEISKAGHEIGSHSMRHRILCELSSEELKEEVIKSKLIIEDKIGREIKGFSYPWGACAAREITTVKEAGYAYAVTVGKKHIEDHGFLRNYYLERKTMTRKMKASDFEKFLNFKISPWGEGMHGLFRLIKERFRGNKN